MNNNDNITSEHQRSSTDLNRNETIHTSNHMTHQQVHLANKPEQVSSPLRRPLSISDAEAEELEDFAQDPNIQTVARTKKKAKKPSNAAVSLQNTTTSLLGPNSVQPQRLNSMIATIPAPATTSNNLSQQQQQHSTPNLMLTEEAKAFAQSRYPFPPFIVRFSRSPQTICDQKLMESLRNSIKNEHGLELELCGYRKSSVRCATSECDILIFVKTSESFCMLLKESSWPATILGLPYSKPSIPAIPPQLSLIVKNVHLSTSLTAFTESVKTDYPSVVQVVRMKNKNQLEIKLVKLDFSEPTQRKEILDRGKIFVNSLSYDVDEYLAPARVLICSKCMGIGHFRKQCKQQEETCKKCGQAFNDVKDHSRICSQLSCIHCQGQHASNDMKCPIVKQFRAALTKQVLAPVSWNLKLASRKNLAPNSDNFPTLAHPQPHSSTAHGNRPNEWFNIAYQHTIPSAPPAWSNSNEPSMATPLGNSTDVMNQLVQHMNQTNTLLEKILNKNHEFEKFIKEKSAKDDLLNSKVDCAITDINHQSISIAHMDTKTTLHDNILMKLVLPLLDELSSFLSNVNTNNQGSARDADFKVKIDRFRAQLRNVHCKKDF